MRFPKDARPQRPESVSVRCPQAHGDRLWGSWEEGSLVPRRNHTSIFFLSTLKKNSIIEKKALAHVVMWVQCLPLDLDVEREDSHVVGHHALPASL